MSDCWHRCRGCCGWWRNWRGHRCQQMIQGAYVVVRCGCECNAISDRFVPPVMNFDGPTKDEGGEPSKEQSCRDRGHVDCQDGFDW